MASLPARVWRAFVSAVADTPDPNKVGSQRWNADLSVFLGTVCDALSHLDLSADKLPYFTGASSAALTSLTAYGRLLIAAADSPTALALLAAVNKAGDSMAGDLNFNGIHKATGLAAPTAPTDAANKAYVDALAAVVSGALVFKTAWDASTGVFPGAGAAQIGWFYKVSVAGTVNGVFFSVGDDIYAIANNASTTTYANNWLKIEGTLTLAEIQAAVGFTFGALAAASTITASLISDASANGRSLIQAADYTAMRTLLGLGSLATLSSITASLISDATANGRSLIQAANYAAMNLLLGLEGGTGVGDIGASLSSAKFTYTTAVLTAPRVWALPAANSVQKGREIIVGDLAGGVTATNSISFGPAGGDTINGGANAVLDVAFGWVRFVSDGTSKWIARATVPYGTAAGNAVRLDANAKLPALDATQLTGVALYGAAQALTNAQKIQALANIGAGGLAGARNLLGVQNGVSPNTKYDISADRVTLRSSADGTCDTVTPAGTLTCDTGLAGPAANGRDQVGAFAASTWLHFYYIWGAAATLATTVSTVSQATGPTLPAGYTHWAYVGAVFFNGSSQLVNTRISGPRATYPATALLVDRGAAVAETAVSTGGFVPPNALHIYLDVVFFGVTADGAGNYNTSLKLRYASGSDYITLTGAGVGGANAAMFFNGGGLTMPNVGQNFYYLSAASIGSSPLFTVRLLGYDLPNGAS